jgi:CRISPR system Cascade subunit CasB
VTSHCQPLVEHLQRLKSQKQLGPLATLRHSLAFSPGAYPPAYPIVERYVGRERHALDGRRLALYVVAGLYARNPRQQAQSFATAWAHLKLKSGSESIEHRFIALLEADADSVAEHLRHAFSLLAAHDIGCDFAALGDDLCVWMDPQADPNRRDRIRQQWVRDFYRALQPAAPSSPDKDD